MFLKGLQRTQLKFQNPMEGIFAFCQKRGKIVMEPGKMVCLILGVCDELAKIQKRAGVVPELANRDHCEQTSLWVGPLGRDEKSGTVLNMLKY